LSSGGSSPNGSKPNDSFDRDTTFVNWEERLAYDLPFLLGELQRVEARRVLDVACGTGWYATVLSQRGYQVVGADISAGMIERA